MVTRALEDTIVAILTRFLRQNAALPDERVLRGIAERLGGLVGQHGLPSPVRSEADGDGIRPGDEECARRTAVALGNDATPLLAEATKQLVKALFYPELKECRLSFKAVTADGSCRRQEPDRVRRRVSGTHCVDCPHWRALSPERHRVFLERPWHDGTEAFRANAALFLPEDFRALRQWIASARKDDSTHT